MLNTFSPNESGPNDVPPGVQDVVSDHGFRVVYGDPLVTLDVEDDHDLGVGLALLVQQDHGVAITLGSGVLSDHGAGAGLSRIVTSDHGIAVLAMKGIANDHGTGAGVGRVVWSDHSPRVDIAISESDAELVNPPPNVDPDDTPTPPMDLASWQAAIRQNDEDIFSALFKRYTVTLTLVSPRAGTSWDLTPYLTEYRIHLRRNEPCDWEFTLADYDFRFVPWGGELSPYIKGANIDANYAVKNYLVLKLSEGGLPWESPRLIQTDKRWNFDGSVPVVSLTGTDYSELMLGDNLSMDDFVSTPAHIYTAKEVIRAILSHYNISSSSLDFVDFQVPRFAPKGSTPLDWIKSLLWVRQAEWYWDRDVFRAQSRYSSGLAIIRDIYHMKNVGFTESNSDLRNEFVVKKTAASSDMLGEFEYFSPDVPGFVGGEGGVSFTESRNARIVIEDLVFGRIENVVWWNDNGPISTMPALGAYQGPVPVNKVVMTYVPGTPFPAGVKAHIKGMIVGEAAGADYYPPGVKKAFSKTVKDDANQAEYGVRRDTTPQDATYVPDEATAVELGLALINESKRMMNQCNWSGILFPTLAPGMQANIYATVAGSLGRAYYIESVTKQGTDEEHMMTVETSHFPT